ncbi:MAG: MFS transporter, partial [Candidatus Zixiibacteriota bacterium]
IPWFFAKFTTGLYSGVLLEKFVPAAGEMDAGTLWLIYALIASATPVMLVLSRKWLSKGVTAA